MSMQNHKPAKPDRHGMWRIEKTWSAKGSGRAHTAQLMKKHGHDTIVQTQETPGTINITLRHVWSLRETLPYQRA